MSAGLRGEPMPTIADVAAHAGVGLGTVSRVLNGSPEGQRRRPAPGCWPPSRLLDYRPNPLARGLSRGRCQTLGVVVPFFTHASAVERLRGRGRRPGRAAGTTSCSSTSSRPVHRDEHLASLTGRDRADGLLVLSLPVPERDLGRLTGGRRAGRARRRGR